MYNVFFLSEAESLTAKVCYGLLMSVLYITFPGIYAIIAATINDAFGPDHYQVIRIFKEVCVCV